MLVAVLCAAPSARATAPEAFLTINGQGMAPNQAVSLTTGPKQTITAKTAPDGSVVFNNLRYVPSDKLTFALSYSIKGGAKLLPNDILINLDPYTGTVLVNGNATRAASIVVSVTSEDSSALVANQDGYFYGTAETMNGFDRGNFRVVTSIINVDDGCCPRTFKPYTPVTITISASPEIPAKKAELPLIESTDTAMLDVTLPEISYGASVPPELINRTYIDGMTKLGERISNALKSSAVSLGGFLQGQANVDAMRSLQQASASVAKDFLPSDQLCRYASLSQSLVSSEAIGRANKSVLSQMLLNTELGTQNTQAGMPGLLESRLQQLSETTCDKTDANGAISKTCKKNTDDTRLNKDVDYTSLMDAPMTVPFDFNNVASEPQGQDVLALAQNLFPSINQNTDSSKSNYIVDSNNYLSLQAIRSVAKNSFVSLLSEKAQGTSGSAQFITNLMKSLGLDAAVSERLMGAKPSYYAQMEVLTKKIYQDPAFYINLVDTPANVARQRAAIRAIKLQQQNDFAAVVKRREMLLAVLLELKIREHSKAVDQRLKPAKTSE